MEIDRARYLASPEGRAAVLAHTHEDVSDPVRLSTRLRASFPPHQASAVAEQLVLRARAGHRFGHDPGLALTSRGLEMMTHPAVAARRAERFAGIETVVDLTCGLGGDLRFLAARANRAIGVERDRATALLARVNVAEATVLHADAERPPIDLHRTGIFIDPSRREGSRRTFDATAFTPAWDACLALARAATMAAVKGAPGITTGALPPDAEVEFVQLGRSLREAALWFGEGAVAGLRRAVLLPGGDQVDSTAPEAAPEPAAAGAFLLDPESCVTRAGLVRHLGARLGARLLDPRVAYLTCGLPAQSDLAATFELLEVMEFGVGRLRALLRARRWRPVEIRRRAFPVEPDELRRLVGATDGDPVALLCTTIGSRRTVFVCRRVARSNCANV